MSRFETVDWMSGILGTIFGKQKGLTTNPATRPFLVIVGSGMDVMEGVVENE